MSYERLLREGVIRPHRANLGEIAALLSVVERDLKDAEVPGLSSDRRFAIAYNAALQSATVVLYAEGYRSAGMGHHHTTFRFLGQTTISDGEV